MRRLLDESLSPQQAASLRDLGHDAIAVLEIGLAGMPDERIREFAIVEDRVLLTLDAGFAHVLRFPPQNTPGVIRLKVHPPTEEAVRELIRSTMERLQGVSIAGCLAVAQGDVIRVRR